jgi:hypothetical protein
MTYDHFQVQFNWKNSPRQVQIRTEKVNGISPVIATYEVIWNNTHLFTIYPTFNSNCRKVWKIVEKERESHLPYGFISVLGNIIEDVYIAN